MSDESFEMVGEQLTLLLLTVVRAYELQNEQTNKAIWFHCRGGFERSAIVFTLFQCYQILRVKNHVNVFEVMTKIRRARLGCFSVHLDDTYGVTQPAQFKQMVDLMVNKALPELMNLAKGKTFIFF